MKILYNLYPNGLKKALTVSYDDGREYDLRLLQILNQHGIKGSFHLNSSNLNKPGYLSSVEVTNEFCGHEISAHTYSHPRMDLIPDTMAIEEVMKDRQELEMIVHYPVRGMSYPFGVYDERIINIVKSVGIEYSRTVSATYNFNLPKNFLEWHPTCHHNQIGDLWTKFKEVNPWNAPALFYLWGHSYEFEKDNTWSVIEDFCEKAGNHNDIWYATNIEISDYINAIRKLKYSAAHDMILNKSSVDIWLTINDKEECIRAGEMYAL